MEPAHQLEFEDVRRIVSAVFSPDASELYVHVHTEQINVWAALVLYWPELGAALLLVALLAGACVVRRIVHRPQSPGIPYCRACNFDLRAHCDAEEGPQGQCPECGRSIGRVRRGRSARRRLAPAACLVLLFAAHYVTLHAIGASRTGKLSRAFQWPSTSLHKVAVRHNWTRLKELYDAVDRVFVVDPLSGETIRRLGPYRGTSWVEMVLSPNGRTLYRIGSSRRSQLLHAIDIHSGRVVESTAIPLDRPMPGSSPIVAATPDGLLLAGRTGDSDVLMQWTPSGLRTLIEEAAWDTRETWMVVADAFDNPTRVVATSSFMEAYDTGTVRIRVFELGENRLLASYELPAGPTVVRRAQIASGAAPVVLGEGAVAVYKSASVRTGLVGIDLESGETSLVDPPGFGETLWEELAVTWDRRLIAVGGLSDTIHLRDVQKREWVGSCDHEPGLIAPTPVLSRNGERLAAIAARNTNSGFESVLLLYDLESMLPDRVESD